MIAVNRCVFTFISWFALLAVSQIGLIVIRTVALVQNSRIVVVTQVMYV